MRITLEYLKEQGACKSGIEWVTKHELLNLSDRDFLTKLVEAEQFDETTEPFLFPTLFKVAKLRIDGSVQRFVGKQYFNTQINGYENGYSVYTLKKSRQELEPIPENRLPFWAKVKYEENEVPF